MKDYYEIRQIESLAMRESFDLALKFNFDIEEIILKNYFLSKEGIDKEIKLSEESPINEFNIYSKKYAAYAILNYELFKNREICLHAFGIRILVERKKHPSEYFQKARMLQNVSEKLAKKQIRYYEDLFKG